MKILIKNGRVIDPANGIDGILDILVEDAKIKAVSENIKSEAGKIIDASGSIVIPGIVDMHAHLREPGREDKETVAAATTAAIRGGVTSVLAMSNTSPCMDSAESIELLKEIIARTAKANVFICGAITKDRMGKEMAAISAIKKSGAVAISDDGASVDSAGIFEKALQAARAQNIPVICHCEDRAKSNNGVVNSGLTATRMGLRGISSESEYKRVERDVCLAKKTGAAIHIAHVSCKESVEIIAQAKRKGTRVTAEAAPHHFSLDEEAALKYDTNFKMNPPLRSKEDVTAIKQALKDGTIEVIASDHAPHTENEKEIEFDRAEFGVIGLETELAVSITELVVMGILSWPELVKKLCFNPAKILGIPKGSLSAGCGADIAVVSSDEEWVVKKEKIFSKSKNSPYINRRLKGLVRYTICGGELHEIHS